MLIHERALQAAISGVELRVALCFFPEEKGRTQEGRFQRSGAEFEQFSHPWNLLAWLDAVRTISDLLKQLLVSTI